MTNAKGTVRAALQRQHHDYHCLAAVLAGLHAACSAVTLV